MAALSSALDTMQTLQLGENGTVEYGWSNEVQELITQFNFQLVRCSDHQELKNMYQKLLYKIHSEQMCKEGDNCNIQGQKVSGEKYYINVQNKFFC